MGAIGRNGHPSTLKVVHVVLSLDVGGLERNVVNQVREGRKLGQDVSVLCLERRGDLAETAEVLGGRVICAGKRPGLRAGMIQRLRGMLDQIQPDVVHTHQICPLLYAGLAATLSGVPLIVHTEHGRERYGDRFRTRWLGRLAGLFAARFFCLTEDMAEHVRGHRIVHREKIHVIHNGIDTALFEEPCDWQGARRSLGIPLDAPVVGTVGRLTEIKRQEVLIRAFAEVRRHVPAAHLVIVGDGPRLAELRELAAQLDVGESVHFAGYHAHTGAFLQGMNVFALSSRSEGMPQAVLEACVTGLPVVATRVGGLPEVIEDGMTGWLVASGDHAGMAERIGRALRDEDLARRIGGQARARVKSQFSVARMAVEYHRQFLEMLAGGVEMPPMTGGFAGAIHGR